MGAYLGSLYSPDHKQYQAVTGNQRGYGDYRGPSQSLPDVSGLPSPIERAIANPSPATGEDHEKRDLAAQEASALWAFWMVVASFASVFITAVGTAFLYKQIVLTREAVEDTGRATEAMQRQNEISEEGLEAQARAWLNITISDPPRMHIYNGVPTIRGRVFVENIGKTPARGVTWVVSFVDKDVGVIELLGIQEYYDEDLLRHESILFPTRSFDKDFSAPYNAQSFGVYNNGLSLVLSVFYKTVFSETVRCTAHIFDLSDSRVEDGWIDLGHPVNSDSLVLTPSEDHVGFAD